jgi:hypothetical protein
VTPMAPRVSAVRSKPLLLFDDECAVGRHMARWVQSSAQDRRGEAAVVVRAIGEDPDALRELNPDLDIWDVYATSHLLMPDGAIRLGGEAVGMVLRNYARTQWLARSFAIRVFGFRPFQMLLNLGYAILSDVRPIFGCASRGASSLWVRPIAWIVKQARAVFGDVRPRAGTRHFSPRSPRPAPSTPAS